MRENLLVKTFKNRFVPIVLVAFLFAVAAICFDIMWVRPVFQVDSKVVVSAKSGNTSSTQIETVKSFVTSRSVLGEVKEKLKLRSNVEDLAKKIEIDNSNSKIVKIKVKDTVINRARDIADELADSCVANKADEYDVKVLEYSSAPNNPVSPDLVRDTLRDYCVGFVVALIAFMVSESNDDIMRKYTNLDELGVYVIGDIPYVAERGAIIDEG